MFSFSLVLTALCSISMATVSQKYDCGMRQAALDYAHKLQPWLSASQLKEIADALNGAKEAKNCSVAPRSHWTVTKTRSPPTWSEIQTSIANTIFVSPSGIDTNPGTYDRPVFSIQTAVEKSRKLTGSKTIVLRGGIHYVPNTVVFTPKDHDLTIQNAKGEEAVVSGAVKLKTNWKAFNTKNGMNVYVTDLSGQVTDVPGLRVNGKRAIRARYPNGIPETHGFSSSLTTKWVPPTLPKTPDIEINPSTPYRNTGCSFQKYNLGIGGPCKGFTPPAGYWCGTARAGGGPSMYEVPSGIIIDSKVLPHSPYKSAKGAVIQAWRPAHWASWMFAVGSYDASSGTMNFSKGGFQGARGNSKGAEFYIENVMEELDYPTEYFFNTTTKQLYYFHNGTNGPSASDVFEATQKKVLFHWNGTMTNPIKNVALRGTTLKDTAITFLDPHGMPSGGDWGLQRTGALLIEGTEGTVIEENVFTRLDGNAIMVSAYNRNLSIHKNEFVWIGDTAIAQWGNTLGAPQDKAPGMGWDGTNGDQPRGSQVTYNFVHELGIWEKQSSFYFQAKSCQNHLEGNIFFNGPRAGINFNDGFGGGNRVTKNVQFNTCRESGDHGPFNSWDRQVYVTKVATGKPSFLKKQDEIDLNLFIANYDSQEAIDNDDGSCYFSTHNNWFSYSGNGLKSDFCGHDNHHFDNLYGYGSNRCFEINIAGGQLASHIDQFSNNTCALDSTTSEYGSFACQGSTDTWPVLGSNTIWGKNAGIGLCGKTEAEFQKAYPQQDKGTKVSGWPANGDDILLAAGRKILGL